MLALIAIGMAAGAGGGWTIGRIRKHTATPNKTARAATDICSEGEATPPPILTTDTPDAPTADTSPPGFATQLAAAESLSVPPPPFDPAAIDLTLIPQRCTLTLTLATATLRYVLVIANAGPVAAPPLVIGLDIAAAGAAPPPRRAPGPGSPLSQHRLDGIAPGDSIDLRGQLVLSLDAGSSLDLAGAQLLLVLVRMRMGLIPAEALAATPSAAPLPPVRVRRAQAFLIGAAAESATTDDAVTPFRLDLAPTSWDRLAMREVDPVPDAIRARADDPADPLS